MRRSRNVGAILIALMCITAPIAANGQFLTGAGSTFLSPIMDRWSKQYLASTGVTVNYQANGSGAGVSLLINRLIDFAGSDAPMNDRELRAAGAPVLHIPVVIGTECVAYHVPGIGPGIHLTGPVVAEIYLGKISYWDDASIVLLNPGTHFPHHAIGVVHRGDGSGTTYILTDYLSKISSDWRTAVGVGKTVRWPVGTAARGNDGVAATIKSQPYSIGYIELAYAIKGNIPYAAIRNAAGSFVYPSAASAAAAATGVSMPRDMRVSITNTANPGGYPIAGFSWIIMYGQSSSKMQLRRFIQWVLTTGQAEAEPLGYAPLPPAVLSRSEAQIGVVSLSPVPHMAGAQP